MKRLLELTFGKPLPILAAGFLLSAFITLATETQLRSGIAHPGSSEFVDPSLEAPEGTPQAGNTSTEPVEGTTEDPDEEDDINLQAKPYDYEDVWVGDSYSIPLTNPDGTLLQMIPFTVSEIRGFRYGNPLPIPHSEFYFPVPPELLADEEFVERLTNILTGTALNADPLATTNDEIAELVVTSTGERGPCINLTWSGNISNVWDIGATQNWFNTDSGNAPDVYMDTDNTTFDDSGTNTSVFLLSDVEPGNIIFNNNTKDYVISGNTGTETITTGNPFTLTVNGSGNVTLNTLLAGNFTTIVNTSSDSAEFRLNSENISPFEIPSDDPVDFAAIGANNTLYTGTVTLNRGRIVLGNDVALGSGSLTIDHMVGAAELVLQDGVEFYNSITVADGGSGTGMRIELGSGEATIAGPVVINETTQGDFAFEVSTGATLTASGNMSGQSLSLNNTISGNTGGTVVLSGTNSHSETILNQGVTLRASSSTAVGNRLTMNNNTTLQLSDNTNLVAANGIVISDGGVGEIKTIQLNDPSSTESTISASITILEDTNSNVVFDVDTDHELTISGVISGVGDGGFQKTGDGTLILSNASTYSGNTVHQEGTLIIAGNNLGATGDFIVADGAILGGEGRIGGDISFGNTTGATFLVDAGTPGALQFAGTLDIRSGNNTIAIERMPEDPGTGIIILAQYSSLVGNISDLSLDVNIPVSTRLGIANPIKDLGNLLVLDLAIQARTWSGDDPTKPTYWDNETTPNWGGLTWVDGDSAIFDAAASYNVELQGNRNASKVTFKNGVGNDYFISGANGTETLTSFGDDGFDFEGDGNVNVDVALAGDAGLLKTGDGTVVLNRDSTFSRGTVIESGPLVVNSDMALGTGDVTLTNGGTNPELVIGTSGVNVANNIEVNGDGVTLSLAANVGTFSGDVNLRGGGKGGGGNLRINVATDSRLTFSGVIGPQKDSGGIEKVGNGTAILTGNNTYEGDTDITTGTLLINGQQRFSTSKIDSDPGTVLGGYGFHGGKIHLHDGGTMNPGDPIVNNGAGVFTGGDEIEWFENSTYVWELITNTDDSSDRGTLFDGVDQRDPDNPLAEGNAKLKIKDDNTTFSVDLDNGTVDFSDLSFWGSDREWLVVDYNDGKLDKDQIFTNLVIGLDSDGDDYTTAFGSFSLFNDDNGTYDPANEGIYLVWTAAPVPEPSTYAIMALGLAGMGWYVKRRRKRQSQECA